MWLGKTTTNFSYAVLSAFFVLCHIVPGRRRSEKSTIITLIIPARCVAMENYCNLGSCA